MPFYECVYCNFKTKLKTDYKRHLNTKKHKTIVQNLEENKTNQCVPIKMTQNDPKMTQNDPKMTQNASNPIQNNLNKQFRCDYCDKPFSSKAHKRRHELHRCKSNIAMKNKIIAEHEKEKAALYKLLEANGSMIHNTNSNNTINNVNTNNTNNIQQTNNIVIRSYGNEDLSHLTDSVLDKLISAPGDMINNLTKLIHFNKDKPENMNMYIPSRKQKHIKIYKDNQWIYEPKAIRIPDLIDRNYLILDSHYEDCGGKNRVDITTNKHYKNFQKLIDQKDNKLIKQEQEACEYEILNNSALVIDQHKLKY